MEIKKPVFEKYVFVCENTREDGKCCAPAGTVIREKIKERVAQLGFKSRIRVSRSGCLDVCAQGPNVLVMPDEVWFNRVETADVERIVEFIIGQGSKG